MMKNNYYLPTAIALAVMALSACQSDSIKPESYGNDAPLTFNVSLYGTNKSIETKSSELLSADRQLNIPLTCVESEGIDAGLSAEGRSAVSTKGEQINADTDTAPLFNFADKIDNHFYIAAFNNNGTRFIPGSAEVTEDPQTHYKEARYINGTWTVPGTEYIWAGTETKTFYAFTNLPAKEEGVLEADITCVDDTKETLTYTILPADARKQKDILVGFYQGEPIYDEVARKGGIAEITFVHPMTAVKFVKGTFDGITAIKFKSISISNTYAGGTAVLTPASAAQTDAKDKVSWTPGTTMQEVTLSPVSGQTELAVEATTGVIGGTDGTFLLVPQNLAEQAMTITVLAEIDGVETVLTAHIEEGQWKAGYTNTYTLGYDNCSYVIEVTENNLTFSNTDSEEVRSFNVTSYKYPINDEASSTIVPFDAEYSIDGKAVDDEQKVWFPFGEGSLGNEITGLSPTGNLGATGFSARYLTARKRTDIEPASPYKWTEDTPVGSPSNPVDLSKLGIGGESTTVQNTANCYIVKHPGYYKFPCVYGNSIQGGTPTSAGYKSVVPSATNAHILLSSFNSSTGRYSFLNSQGKPINDDPSIGAYVISDVAGSITGFDAGKVKACILWCDALDDTDGLLVRNVELHYAEEHPDEAYISFETIDKDKMVQGNAVIVLYYDSNATGYLDDEGEALWSWHIWVTDAGLGTDNVGEVGAAGSESGSYSFMSRNLGWCEGFGGNTYKATNKNIQIRIRQSYGKNREYRYIYVSQPDVFVSGTLGNCMYYQYGRKDPFIGRLNSTTQKSFYRLDDSGDIVTLSGISKGSPLFEYGTSMANANLDIVNSIKYPFYSATYNDRFYRNVWMRDNYETGSVDTFIKTIYDPSPYGYKVPNANAFSYWATSDDWVVDTSTSHRGVTFKNKNGEFLDNLFFPAMGYIWNGDFTKFQYYGTICYYACVDLATDGSIKCLVFPGGSSLINTSFDRVNVTPIRPILELPETPAN